MYLLSCLLCSSVFACVRLSACVNLQVLWEVVSVDLTGLKPKLKVDDFQDLLGAEGFNVPPKDKQPQMLDDLKDKDDLANETDPDKVKVWGATLSCENISHDHLQDIWVIFMGCRLSQN